VAAEPYPVIYWDASAILPVLFVDTHSESARASAHQAGLHLISTLTYTETCAVIARLRRERVLADVLIQAAFEVLEEGPWRRLTAWPEWSAVRSLSVRWPLRGADLWHLALAKSLQAQLPEIRLLTFDARLRAAAEGEKLSKDDVSLSGA
jgi:predicted nucleic acid-binding protein